MSIVAAAICGVTIATDLALATVNVGKCRATASNLPGSRMYLHRYEREERRGDAHDPDTTEEEVAEDAAGACFGENTEVGKPIPELAKLLKRLEKR